MAKKKESQIGTRKKKKTPEDYLKEALDILQEGTRKVFDSDRYKMFLDCCSKFHSYSAKNTVLICMQQPNATRVAGYKTWEALGRKPIRDMHGIRILKPNPVKVEAQRYVLDAQEKYLRDESGNPIKEKVELTLKKYVAVTVFDISQTEGEPLPSLADELVGDVKDYKNMIKAIIRTSKLPVEFDMLPAAKGYFSQAEGKIVINIGMSEKQTFKTLIHERAHSMLHVDYKESRNQREVEAESVAFVVCNYYGIDTSDYSFEYVAGWSQNRTTPELEKALDIIKSTASKIIVDTDKELSFIKASEIQKEEKSKKRDDVQL